jgi:Cu(I)/Ag(I) efflux system protein CusF
VDKDKVTIKHEPVPSMNWPSMTMAFLVKDKAVMEKIKKDQKVDFEFVQQGKDYVVTAVK